MSDANNESSASLYNYETPTPQTVFDSFNKFIFSIDMRVLGKLLWRNNAYIATKHLPGDIVEIGVFKGSGIASWLKILTVFDANTNKKVIGFDFFSGNDVKDYTKNISCGEELNKVIDRVNEQDVSYENVTNAITGIGINKSKFLLIKGDVRQTTQDFAYKNPGFRISILYLDADLGEPTYYALINLWDRIVPGGYIVFDEYEYHSFDECSGVERFLKERGIEYTVESTHMPAPSAFMIKKKF